jgi:hypothetical protein
VLIYRSQSKPGVARELLKFFDWAYHDGAKLAESLDSQVGNSCAEGQPIPSASRAQYSPRLSTIRLMTSEEHQVFTEFLGPRKAANARSDKRPGKTGESLTGAKCWAA